MASTNPRGRKHGPTGASMRRAIAPGGRAPRRTGRPRITPNQVYNPCFHGELRCAKSGPPNQPSGLRSACGTEPTLKEMLCKRGFSCVMLENQSSGPLSLHQFLRYTVHGSYTKNPTPELTPVHPPCSLLSALRQVYGLQCRIGPVVTVRQGHARSARLVRTSLCRRFFELDTYLQVQ